VTVAYTSLVDGDVSAGLTTQPPVTTAAATGSDIGTGPITAPPAVDADVSPAVTMPTAVAPSSPSLVGRTDLTPTETTSLVGHIAAAPLGSQPTLADERMTIAAAEPRWATAGGNALTAMVGASGQDTDLRVGRLSEAAGGTIVTSPDDIGHGWFADPASAVDAAFASTPSSQQLQAVDPRAVDWIDLLSAVEHELRHVAGLGDLDAVPDDMISCMLGEAS
jgi:hypothetical protein